MSRIMIVDDDPFIRQLLSYQLVNAGYDVCAVSNGMSAIERLLVEQPHLVLLDVVMPDMNGWDVCHQMRCCSAVPIIMLTAKSGEQDVVTGLGSGADDYIAKPFHMSQLLARVEAVLRRSYTHYPNHSLNAAAGASASVALPAREQPTAPAACLRLPLAAVVPGRQFIQARHRRGISLREAATACDVQWEWLQALEHEQFDAIPLKQLPRIVLRYSEFLDIDVIVERNDTAEKRTQPLFWLLYVVMSVVVVVLLITLLIIIL